MHIRNATEDEWLVALESLDERAVVAALHAACPCSGSSTRYEQYLSVLRRFEKDPRASVRKTALHLQLDAFEELAKDDERAEGFVRNRPGGNERKRERA